jgi:hypothetical protein
LWNNATRIFLRVSQTAYWGRQAGEGVLRMTITDRTGIVGRL